MQRYLKAIYGGLVAGLGALSVAYTDDILTKKEGIVIATSIITALGVVWAVPNAKR